jgi:hypothetical protein
VSGVQADQPRSDERVDCGWSFANGAMTAPRLPPDRDAEVRARHDRATGQIAFGAFLLLIGVVITAVTYDDASRQGGMYIIAYGPIVVGIIKIVRGLSMRAG